MARRRPASSFRYTPTKSSVSAEPETIVIAATCHNGNTRTNSAEVASCSRTQTPNAALSAASSESIRQAMFLQPPVQRRLGDTEQVCRLLFVRSEERRVGKEW